MFGLKNTLIRETIARLQDPENWNPDGSYRHGKKCIVTACFDAAVERSTRSDCNHRPALRVIRETITNQYGDSRKSRWREDGVIIGFNDHPLTTHADVMAILHRAERRTRPFWRGPMEGEA